MKRAFGRVLCFVPAVAVGTTGMTSRQNQILFRCPYGVICSLGSKAERRRRDFRPARRYFRRANPWRRLPLSSRQWQGPCAGEAWLSSAFSERWGGAAAMLPGMRGISIVGALAGFFISTRNRGRTIFLCVKSRTTQKPVQYLVRCKR